MRWRKSLFTKTYVTIVILALISALAVGLFVFGQYRLRFKSNSVSALPQFYKRNSMDLGISPDPEKGRILAERLGVDIFYFGKSSHWQTLEDPAVVHFMENISKRGRDIQGYRDRKLYVGFSDERGYFVFYGNPLFNIERLPVVLGTFLLIGSLPLIITFFVIRMLLLPLKRLEQGVSELNAGNLSFRVSPVRDDELGALAKAFNHMAEQIQQMISDKEQLILDVSHELKTPITRIKLSLEFLENEALRKSLEEDVDEMDLKVQELLTSARLNTPYGSPKREKTELAAFLLWIIGQYGKDPPGAVLLPGDPAVFVEVDQGLFQTACKNVLENAIRYSRPNAPPVELWYEVGASFVDISFRDHGVGIASEHLDRVFEPFYRVDRSRDRRAGGYGLGFYLVKKIVTAHDGTVLIESEVGKGTLVTIRIPRNNSSN
jgi:signal transduction histidine kinase